MLQSIKKLRREITNLIVQLTPWEMRIKKIESKSRIQWNVVLRYTFRDNVFGKTKILPYPGQFGSVVASYFTFLRWVFWINTFISIFICVFLMVPEVIMVPCKRTDLLVTDLFRWSDPSRCPGSNGNEERGWEPRIGAYLTGHLGLRGLYPL